jgi:hypothetical protein
MQTVKCEKVSISLPSDFIAAIEAEQFRRKLTSRSAWIQEACERALKDAGAFPGSPVHEVRELAAHAAEVIGAEKVIAMLTALGAKKLATVAAEKEVA